MKYTTTSREDTQAFAGKLAQALVPGDVVLLYGEIGMGKSVMARAAARALGVRCAMPSPTFTLMQPYQGDVRVYHLDLYRLSDADEYFAAGLDEYVGSNGISFIEWPMDGLGIDGAIQVSIDRGDEFDSRRIDVEAPPGRAEEICAAISAWEAPNDDIGG
ncbi:MAG: tRNA (adenosine(37)-N6)-threonylcarbamoyltransferase complex ATPase subunit type 1 TsaE [Clostridia bacterium]|nr:tRNA (adenosine(37)-N6)-threonylcarbamoyltransferase complex ATPase subunit type 1 TsaE [Clostridia bacterium]